MRWSVRLDSEKSAKAAAGRLFLDYVVTTEVRLLPSNKSYTKWGRIPLQIRSCRPTL
jgi:hypothetical protein